MTQTFDFDEWMTAVDAQLDRLVGATAAAGPTGTAIDAGMS
jgi:hypothetical protein